MKKIISSLLIVLVALSFLGSSQSVQASSTSWQMLPARQNKMDPSIANTLARLPSGQMITVIVTLNKQTDLSQVKGGNRATHQKEVIEALQATSDLSQGQLKQLLNTRKGQGKVKDYVSFWVFNGFSVTATGDVINELAGQPEVYSITPDDLDIVPTTFGPAEPNISLVNAPALWSQGYTGSGVVVASMDSGVDVSHPDLSSKWRGGSNSWYDPYSQHSTPADLSGHGTWTTGIMVGGSAGGTTVGVAPDAKWIAVKIFNDSGTSTATAIHQGFQWLLNPDGNSATDDAPNVVNNSWTYANPGCYLDFESDLQALRAADILPVFAAGNGGPYANSSYSPSNNPSAFAVGAVDNNSQVYPYSSRGTTTCGGSTGPYPELVAPGVNIRTTGLFGTYYVDSGTSFASPHVAGSLALLLSAYPYLHATDQEQALINTGSDLGASGPDDVFGYGLLNIFSAYNWVAANVPPPNVNLALNKPVTVSSYQDTAHIGAMAVDGNQSTLWQTQKVKGKGGSSSEWIEIDLGTSQSISQVNLSWDAYYATNYSIQVSNDHTNWTTVFSTSTGDGAADTVTFSFIQARYVRMTSSSWNNSSNRNWLKEFEVYAHLVTQAPPPTPTPSPTLPPANNSVHVGDLDASSTISGGRWNATVTVTVHDSSGALVSNVIVNGSWSNGATGTGSCTTGADGTCSVSRNSLKTSVSSIKFTITGLSASDPYQPSANQDPDGDSNGTVIIVSKP